MTVCNTDGAWTANGTPAVIFPFVTGDPTNPTNNLGCELSGITEICANDVTETAVIEPGGPDGYEIIFRTEFQIAPGTDLDAIAFVGEYTADDYVKAGEWKVNGVHQSHFRQGSYTDSIASECIEFGFHNDTAPLIHGTNVIEITVKNGNINNLPVGRGGPIFLRLAIGCAPRELCSNYSTTYVSEDIGGTGTGPYVWREAGSDCLPYCDLPLPPSEPPTGEGQTVEVPCDDIMGTFSTFRTTSMFRARKLMAGTNSIPNTNEGTGTELKKLISWFPIPGKTKCGGCAKLEAQMNQWGPDMCEKKRSYIIAGLTRHAANLGVPAPRFLLNTLLNRAIRNSRKKGH